MRWVFRLAGALVVLVMLALVALALIPSERVARLATDQFTAVTGRELVIEGSVKPTLWPVLGVETGRVTLANAPWSDSGPMLVAEGLSIRLDLQKLLAGEVRVAGFSLLNPDIVIERGKDGVGNWVFGGSNGGSATAGMAGADTPFTLDLATLRGARLRWINHQSGQRLTVEGLDADLRLPAYDGPLTLSASGTMAGQAMALGADIGTFSAAYRGEVVPLTARLTAGDATIGFDGRAGLVPLAAEGQLDADLGDLSALAALAGLPPPALPEGFGARSVTLAGKVTRSAEGDLYLRGGRIGLDGTEVTGDLDLSLGAGRPRLSGNLATGTLALGATGATGGSGAGAAASGWSDAPLAVDGLQALDADLGISVASLRLGSVQLSDLRARVGIDAGRAVIDLSRAGAYGGTAAGQVVVNSRKGLSASAKLDLRGVSLQPLMVDLAGVDRLVGTGDLAVDLISGGSSIAALMQRLDGSGRLALGPGEIRGLDIPAMLAAMQAQDMGPESRTVFDGLTATFAITDGVLVNDDLALQSQFLRAKGAGRIGIGARDIDYSLRASARKGADGQDKLVVPVLVQGPWDNPEIRLDLEAIAREKLDDKAKEAEAEIKRRAGEELGQQQGESLEDAAKRRLQEEIGNQADGLLQQLLGGN